MGTNRNDLRFALRQLRRQPGFTFIAVATLAIGIGAATAVFNAAEVALYRPLPMEHQDRLVRIYRVPEAGTPWISLRPATFATVERNGRFFDRIVGQRYTTLVRPTESGPERLVGIAVTAGWAETLGVDVHLGRSFSPDEERLGAAAAVALLSYGAWQRLFGGDPAALGRTLVLNEQPHTVVGVMERGLRYPYNADVWLPMRVEDEQVGPWSYNALARLRPGVTLDAAREELASLAQEVARTGEAPSLQAEGMTLTAIPFRQLFVGEEGRTSVALLGAVSFLLLIVCANLANLLVARGLNRTRELALRSSLGATRGRLVRQLLTESLVLGGMGAALGVFLAYLGSGLAQPLLPSRLEFVEATVSMNGTVLAFAVGLALLSTLLFGLLPALRLSSAGPATDALRSRSGGPDRRGRSLGNGLVVAEIALGVVLLTAAGLVVQDLRRLERQDLGYDPAGLLTFSVPLQRGAYADSTGRTAFLARAETGLRAVPGIRAAGVTTMFPSDNGNALAPIQVAGREEDQRGERPLLNHRLVTPGFFDALGLPVLQGRGIEERDRAGTLPVAVVSASAARKLWPDQDPIGQQIRPTWSEDAEWLTVVGVVADVRQFYDVAESWYLPYAQHAGSGNASSATFAVRTGGAAAAAAPSVRSAMSRVAPDLPLEDLLPAVALHEASLTRQRQGARLSAAFSAFGLLLAAMGLYGAIAYTVNRRRREFGIRLALGGDARRVVGSVLRQAVGLVAVGVALGAVAALAATRLLAHALETVHGFDPVSFGIAVLTMALTALAAVIVPARRAARVEPATVLREE